MCGTPSEHKYPNTNVVLLGDYNLPGAIWNSKEDGRYECHLLDASPIVLKA